ncbi:MAG: hypothetical protein COA94_02950 [Rickettsiales bacterium]|nr:MAG: hypothetical protein COA94_02950 [Rickettsiales bacterium]
MQVPHVDRFKKNVHDMVDLIGDIIELSEQGNKRNNKITLNVAGLFIKSYDKEKLIDHFILESYKHWETIHKRDETFFLKNAISVFGKLPEDNVNTFKKLFEADGDISDEDKGAIWDFFISLVKICIKYIHSVRLPKTVLVGGEERNVYSNKKYSSVNLFSFSTLYDIKLVW